MTPHTEAGKVTPPFPESMTFREMLTNLFNTDFMTPDELQTICVAGEMYANGCLFQSRKPTPPSLSIEQEAADYANEQCDPQYSHNIAQNRAIIRHYIAGRSSSLKQIEELEAWKKEAISVMPDMHEIGKLLKVPLGQSVHDKIVPGIQELQGKLKIAREALDEIEKGWGWIKSDPTVSSIVSTATEALKKIQ